MRTYSNLIICLTLLAAGASACDASQVGTVVPTNAQQLQSSEPGKALTSYGYTPVAHLFRDHKVVGEAWVNCGEEGNLTACSRDIHNRGSFEHPNVYVIDGKVVQLEGPHGSSIDDRSYRVKVPDSYQDFAGLTVKEQQDLLAVMPDIAQAIGHPSGAETYQVATQIGIVTAWVER